MKLNDLMIRDVRAEIDFEGDKIVINNPKGEVKTELLSYFDNQVERNIENKHKKGKKYKVDSEMDIVKMLMLKLTNIEVDVNSMEEIMKNPSYELNLVMLYLSSIMQELIFEVLATKNLQVRMQKNTLLEKDTLNMLSNVEDVIKEIKHRKMIENGEEIQ